ncbi:MAG: histidinol-phosphatase [Candidatus Zixiibacteriota bacterium]|nr:MAG: histidinol-phosphatase [candidate division Zixibacteria bacterium]
MSDIHKIQPLHVPGVSDYHVHCDYSIDAQGTVDEFCEAAIKRNLAEICFTTHFDANPNSDGQVEYIRVKGENRPVTVENLQPYVEDVRRVAEKYYAEGLSVKLGIEIGWYPGCEEMVERLKQQYHFDYVLCGIHELDNICFCCRHSYERCFGRYSAEQLAEKYYTEVQVAARTGLFDTMAHLAYYLRSGLDYYGDAVAVAHRPHLDETLRTLIDHNVGIEVNTAGIRHGLKNYYPPVEIINSARRAGVGVSFLGSDAHSPEQIGFDFEAALALVPDTVQGCED